MARTVAAIKHCMLTQDFDVKHWDWDVQEQSALLNNDIEQVTKIVVNRLLNHGVEVSDAYSIKHDKDMHEIWDEQTQKKVIEYKTNHIHIVIRFSEAVMLETISDAVGLESEFVERPKSGRYSYDNMLSYLIHAKDSRKHPYESCEVFTLMGKDYMNIYVDRKTAWDKARAKKSTQNSKQDVDWLEEKILTGEVKKAQVLLTDEFFEIYAKNKRRCEEAFDTYAERKVYKTIQSLENGEFKVSVFFVTGRAGSGKSTFTDNLALQFQKEAAEHGEQWEVCSVASSNPFDDYKGEEILVMDDLRGMALTASDWLKLLDPDRINVGSARYKNKKMACRTIIINSEKDVIEFFYFLKGMGHTGAQEAMDQFLRRILARVVVYRYDDEERRIKIGEMNRTDKPKVIYPKEIPGETLIINYDYSNELDLSYDDALSRLTQYLSYMNNWSNAIPVWDKGGMCHDENTGNNN